MKKLLFLPIIFICCLSLATVYSVSVQHNLSDNLIRLHIIANSDSAEDIDMKYQVRDQLLRYARSQKSSPTAEDFTYAAGDYLAKVGVDYGASTSYEYCFVPEKSYKSVTLPRGMYRCLRVVLGEGKGENWWCIAYPPLCYTESMFGAMSDAGMCELENILDFESLMAITQENGVNFRLKIVDEIQRLFYEFAQYKDGAIFAQ